MKPIIFFEGTYTVDDINNLKEKEQIFAIHDIYKSQCEELFEITHPSLKSSGDYKKQQRKFVHERSKPTAELRGNWAYFPWNRRLLHMVGRDEYHELRTNRNKNLITEAEQTKLLDFPIGLAGLSVGSAFALNLAHSSMGSALKLAEYDTLETTNLNRVRARVDQVGMPKVDIVAQQLYEINPYINLVLYRHGLTEQSLSDFIETSPVPRLIFEMIDNFEMKIHLRLAARKARIPVIMFSNLGDNILIDIERYDQDNATPLFNGVVGTIPEEILKNPDKTNVEKNKYAIQLVGPKYIPQRALESVLEIGKTLTGRPQLMSTVSIGGGIAAYLARRIALGDSVPSGRHFVKFDQAFLPQTHPLQI